MAKHNNHSKHAHENHIENVIDNISIYGFVLGVLTLVWMLTGFGYYWPIWFLIGWLIGPQSLPFFQNLFTTFKSYSQILLEKINHTDLQKTDKKKLPQSKDDSDAQGA